MWPLQLPYASSKDRVYLDGLEDVIGYLKESTSVADMLTRFHILNQFKVAIKDIPKMQQIKQELDIPETSLHKSHFIARRLRRALQWLDEDSMQEWSLDENVYKIKVDISELLDIVDFT